ncbi:MAG TPA: hypothetical protein VKA30_06620, partial [Actinomycetota bacterium]|nr:hypothetical protein [Actinomycetota bacterium]
EGVPLYAVETIRMLLDRGLLHQEGSAYVPTGPIEELAVPESLHALIAARLDGLPEEERRLVQDASILGKTFTRQALGALTGVPDAEIEQTLSALVRKEVFGVQQDPRSPEHGQYGFLQSLLRQVAYDTMSKRDRKSRHLAVARYFEESWGADDEEIVQVVASHYLDAYEAMPDAEDAAEIKSHAREAMIRAGRRSRSLASHDEAGRYFLRAADLTDDVSGKAKLEESAGEEIYNAGRAQDAADLYRRAIEGFESQGDAHAAARVAGRLGVVEWWDFHRIDDAVDRLEGAFAQLSSEEHDPDVAYLAEACARLHYFRGEPDLAFERAEFALKAAEWLGLPEVLSQAMNTKALTYLNAGRTDEAGALLRRALEIALEHELPQATVRAYANTSVLISNQDDHERAESFQREAIAAMERYGVRGPKAFMEAHLSGTLWLIGRWDEAMALWSDMPDPEEAPDMEVAKVVTTAVAMYILGARGDVEAALGLEPMFGSISESTDVQDRTLDRNVRAYLARLRGDLSGAAALLDDALEALPVLGLGHSNVRVALVEAIDVAVTLRDEVRLKRFGAILDEAGPGNRAPQLEAQRARAVATLGILQGADAALINREFSTSAALLGDRGLVFQRAVVHLEWAEWLLTQGRDVEANQRLDEAAHAFEGLGAKPALERVEAARAQQAAEVAT